MPEVNPADIVTNMSEKEVTPKIIERVRKELLQWAANLGCIISIYGAYGFAALLLSATEQATLPGVEAANTPFQILDDPGPYIGTTVQARINHEREIANYKAQKQVIADMIKCIKYAFGLDRFAGLQNQHGLVIPTSPYAMFEELYNSCVTDEDKQSTVEKMATEMQEKWDPTTDFDAYTNRQEERREVTNKCGDRATDAQMIRRSLPSMEAVPVLAPAVTEWKKKASADKTWANFKRHFKDELKHMKSGKQKLASLGLVNEVQELKHQLAAYVEKDKERTQEISLLVQAVHEGFQVMANETKENANPNPPAPSTDSELKTLMREILQNNSNTATTALTGNKKQRKNPKGQVALITPPAQTKGAVCTKVDGHKMDGYNYEYSPKCEQRGRKAMVPTLWKMVRKELQQPLDGYPQRVASKGAS